MDWRVWGEGGRVHTFGRVSAEILACILDRVLRIVCLRVDSLQVLNTRIKSIKLNAFETFCSTQKS